MDWGLETSLKCVKFEEIASFENILDHIKLASLCKTAECPRVLDF